MPAPPQRQTESNPTIDTPGDPSIPLRPAARTARLAATASVALLVLTACSGEAHPATDGKASNPPTHASPAGKTAASGSAPGGDAEGSARPIPDSLRGTPAQTWAPGATGLGKPPASPPKGFTHATLNRAVAYARGQLAAGNLEPTTVYRRDTKPFIDATKERNRDDHLNLLASPTAGGRPYTLVSRLPEDAQPDGDVRAKGRYAVKAKRIDGVAHMSLTWRGTFLYPVRDADGRSTVVAVHRRATWNWADEPDWAPGEHWYFEIGNADQCATQRSGLLVPDYTADHLADAIANPYGDGPQADNTDELEQRC